MANAFRMHFLNKSTRFSNWMCA